MRGCLRQSISLRSVPRSLSLRPLRAFHALCLSFFQPNAVATLSEHSSGIGTTCRASATRCPRPPLPWHPPTGIFRPVSTVALMTPGCRASLFPSRRLASATSFALPPFVSVFSVLITTAASSSSIPTSSATGSTLPIPQTGTEIGATTSSAFPTATTSSTRLSGAVRTTRRVGSSSLQRFFSSGTRMNAANPLFGQTHTS